MAKEKQHDIKKDNVSAPDEPACLEETEDWKENSNMSSGRMAKIKRSQSDVKLL